MKCFQRFLSNAYSFSILKFFATISVQNILQKECYDVQKYCCKKRLWSFAIRNKKILGWYRRKGIVKNASTAHGWDLDRISKFYTMVALDKNLRLIFEMNDSEFSLFLGIHWPPPNLTRAPLFSDIIANKQQHFSHVDHQ